MPHFFTVQSTFIKFFSATLKSVISDSCRTKCGRVMHVDLTLVSKKKYLNFNCKRKKDNSMFVKIPSFLAALTKYNCMGRLNF